MKSAVNYMLFKYPLSLAQIHPSYQPAEVILNAVELISEKPVAIRAVLVGESSRGLAECRRVSAESSLTWR